MKRTLGGHRRFAGAAWEAHPASAFMAEQLEDWHRKRYLVLPGTGSSRTTAALEIAVKPWSTTKVT